MKRLTSKPYGSDEEPAPSRHGGPPRRLTGGRASRLAAGLALALLLVLVPARAGTSLAACFTLGPLDTATGAGALAAECGGDRNTADGSAALFANTTGNGNTATGNFALFTNATGNLNTAVGESALGVFGGSHTTALGDFAGDFAQSGDDDTFIGYNAAQGAPGLVNATAVGASATVGESNALVLGQNAKVGIGTSTPDSALTVAGTIEGTDLKIGPGISSLRGPLGVGTQTPHSLLQVGVPSTDYVAFFQPPTVLSPAPPPAGTCNATTFVGRVVLQFNPITKKTTLWACSAAGQWASLGQG